MNKKEVKKLIEEYLEKKDNIKVLEAPIKNILKMINKVKREQKKLVPQIKAAYEQGLIPKGYTVEVQKIKVDAYEYDKVSIARVDKAQAKIEEEIRKAIGQ